MDPAPLTAMFASHSDQDAEAMICRALEDIAMRLDRGCGIALGAVTSRMERCFDAAVTHVWEFRRFT